jgi:hypothetical protein
MVEAAGAAFTVEAVVADSTEAVATAEDIRVHPAVDTEVVAMAAPAVAVSAGTEVALAMVALPIIIRCRRRDAPTQLAGVRETLTVRPAVPALIVRATAETHRWRQEIAARQCRILDAAAAVAM